MNLSNEDEREAGNQLLWIWKLFGGSSEISSNDRELEATIEEISFGEIQAKSETPTQDPIQVIEVDLTTTEESDMDTDEINLKEPPRRIIGAPGRRKHFKSFEIVRQKSTSGTQLWRRVDRNT